MRFPFGGERRGVAVPMFQAKSRDSLPPPSPSAMAAVNAPPNEGNDPKLADILARIQKLTGGESKSGEAPSAFSEPGALPSPASVPSSNNSASLNPPPVHPGSVGGSAPQSLASSGGVEGAQQKKEFVPPEPKTFRQAGLTDTEVESLALKFLLARGDGAGREVADQIKVPFILLEPLLRQLKQDQLVAYKGAAPANDYVHALTDLGRERARRYSAHCTYFGSAPVTLADYIESVKLQSLTSQHPTRADLERESDEGARPLVAAPEVLDREDGRVRGLVHACGAG